MFSRPLSFKLCLIIVSDTNFSLVLSHVLETDNRHCDGASVGDGDLTMPVFSPDERTSQAKGRTHFSQFIHHPLMFSPCVVVNKLGGALVVISQKAERADESAPVNSNRPGHIPRLETYGT